MEQFSNLKCPIPREHLIADEGRVGKYGAFAHDKYNTYFYKYNIGGLYDLCCVAMRKKRLCGMDLTTQTGLEHIQTNLENDTYNVALFYEAMEFLNNMKLPNYQWLSKGNYLKNIYFNPEVAGSDMDALKLMLVLHTDHYEDNYEYHDMDYHIAIGYFLGYPKERIHGYIVRNIDYEQGFDIRSYIVSRIENIKTWVVDKKSVLEQYPIELIYGLRLEQ